MYNLTYSINDDIEEREDERVEVSCELYIQLRHIPRHSMREWGGASIDDVTYINRYILVSCYIGCTWHGTDLKSVAG